MTPRNDRLPLGSPRCGTCGERFLVGPSGVRNCNAHAPRNCRFHTAAHIVRRRMDAGLVKEITR
jgi:hypothetical protein